VTFGNLLKKISCPKIPIKEVYAATNNLNEMNIIGKGTSGELLFLYVKNELPDHIDSARFSSHDSTTLNCLNFLVWFIKS